MKIIATVSDATGVVHAGALCEHRSAIIDIPDDSLPPLLKQYLDNKKWVKDGENRCSYDYLSFSILDED
jgi:hypothetical protein